MSQEPRQVAGSLLAEVLYALQRQLEHSLAAKLLGPCQVEHFHAAAFFHLQVVIQQDLLAWENWPLLLG